MKQKTRKIIQVVMSMCCLIACFMPAITVFASPIPVQSLEEVKETLKSKNETAYDFHYDFTEKDIIAIAYQQKTVDEILMEMVQGKIKDDTINVSLTDQETQSVDSFEQTGVVAYQLTNGKQTVAGMFSYTWKNQIELEQTSFESQEVYQDQILAKIQSIIVDGRTIEVMFNSTLPGNVYDIKVGQTTKSFKITPEYTANVPSNATVENTVQPKVSTGTPQISYQANIQNIGWQEPVGNGEIIGTTGQGLRMESLRMTVTGPFAGGITYQAHVQGIGWQDPVSNGGMAGTENRGLQMEGVKINLTDDLATQYDIYYRAHCQGHGWLGWAKNGEEAGTEGFGYRLEALQILLVKKGEPAPGDTQNHFVAKAPSITYQAHVQGIGWQNPVSDGALAGTTGREYRVEALTVSVSGPLAGGISYQTYVHGSGWQDPVENGQISGTTGQELQLEMIKMNLTGELANQYDVYYRTHCQGFGWLDWAKNGQSAGNSGYGYRLEALEIKLVKKGEPAPGETIRPLAEKGPSVVYHTNIQNRGWSIAEDGRVGGTTGQGLRLESLKMVVSGPIAGGISYQTHVQGIGWQEPVENGQVSGTLNQNLQIEALKINLTGELAKQYDVYYRAHCQGHGWLGWAKNGEAAGTEGYGYRLEAMQVVLVKKGESAPGDTQNHFVEKGPSVFYQTKIQNLGWLNTVADGTATGTIGQELRMESLKMTVSGPIAGGISYQTYNKAKGWQNPATDGALAGGDTSYQIEAIKVQLTGELANQYDVYYRAHNQGFGWLDWAKDNEISGTIGFGYRLEAMQVVLVKKGASAPGPTTTSYVEKELSLNYQAHVQGIGWQEPVSEGNIVGTTGQDRQMEALKMTVSGSVPGGITYQSYVQGQGWQSPVSDGAISGTEGQGLRMEALKINLTGELANQYDIYYQTHVQGLGWMGWAKNGEPAGSNGYGYRVEALRVTFVEKGEAAPGDTKQAYKEANWVVRDGHTYFYNDAGVMATEFQVIGTTKYFFNGNGQLIASNVKKVMDVSYAQGVIDWDTVKQQDNIDMVILRLGYGSKTLDTQFVNNLNAVKRLGIPYTIYLYSYAENATETIWEANFVIEQMRKYQVNPVTDIYYDIESNPITSHLTTADYEAIITSFIRTLNQNGYGAKVYTYKYYAEGVLNSPLIRPHINWIAQYNSFCDYNGSYIGWQYTSSSKVPGITGNVDMSVWF